MQKLTAKQRAWRKRIDDWSTSGLSQVDYCRRHGISSKQFYNWKMRLEKLGCTTLPVASQGVFMPVEIVEDERNRRAASVALRINGVEIHYKHDTDAALLLKLVSLMEARV